MAHTASDINNTPPRDSVAPPPQIRGEQKLIQELYGWLEDTLGASLDLPADLAPLIDSRAPAASQAVGRLRLVGAHTVGQLIAHLVALRMLTAAIIDWSAMPADHPPLEDHLRRNLPAHLDRPIDHVLKALRNCLAPVPAGAAELLGLPTGATWGAAARVLFADPADTDQVAPPSPAATGPNR